ncbi:hypothetical protein STEG23_016426 [Scotinomys teguina]
MDAMAPDFPNVFTSPHHQFPTLLQNTPPEEPHHLSEILVNCHTLLPVSSHVGTWGKTDKMLLISEEYCVLPEDGGMVTLARSAVLQEQGPHETRKDEAIAERTQFKMQP